MPHRLYISDYEPVTRVKSSTSPGDHESTLENGFDRRREDWDPVAQVDSLFETDEQPIAGNEFTQAATHQRESATRIPEKHVPKAQQQGKSDLTALPPPAQPTTTTMSGGPQAEKWLVKRGHSLSFAGLFVFTFILYYRPYEHFSALSSLTSMAFWTALLTLAVFLPTQLALEGTPTARPREVNLVLLLALTALLSIPLAISPGEAWKAFVDPFVKAVLMFLVIVNTVRTERRLKWLMSLGLSVGCVLSAAALNNYRLGNLTVEGYRVEGSIGNLFGNPNDMAIHLVTMLPIAVALMFSTNGLHRRLFYGACAVLLIGGTVVTFSRGGFLGLAGGTLVLMWKIGRRNRPSMVLLMLFGITAFFVLAPGNYYNRLFSIYDNSRDLVGSATARQQLLFRSIIVAVRHPLFGVGMGNFHIVSIREAVSHNAYTQVAAEIGMTAMVLYTMFIVTPIRRLRRIEREMFTARQSSRFYYLAIGLQASLIAYMISSFFGSVAYQWYVYYLVGYAVALRRIYQASSEALADANLATAQVPPTARKYARARSLTRERPGR